MHQYHHMGEHVHSFQSCQCLRVKLGTYIKLSSYFSVEGDRLTLQQTNVAMENPLVSHSKIFISFMAAFAQLCQFNEEQIIYICRVYIYIYRDIEYIYIIIYILNYINTYNVGPLKNRSPLTVSDVSTALWQRPPHRTKAKTPKESIPTSVVGPMGHASTCGLWIMIHVLHGETI